MRRPLVASALALALCGGGCASLPAVPALPALDVAASGETAPVGTGNADAADDPAIWRNPSDPAASLLLGTDKKAGLYVYDLTGKVRDFAAAGALNNVDLRDVRRRDGAGMVLVGASDRTDKTVPRIALFALDGAAAKLVSLGSDTFLPAAHDPAEAYGFCMGSAMAPGELARAYVVMKDGEVAEARLVERDGAIRPEYLRSVRVATQAEGCVVDDVAHALYLAEEDAGIWRFALAEAAPQAQRFASVGVTDGLVADVEGIAIARRADGADWLVASSQGDSAYAVFALADGKPVGRFRIAAGTLGATSETDGIELDTRNFGPEYPGGLFVAQDGDNAPRAQNFKLVRWERIVRALSAE